MKHMKVLIIGILFALAACTSNTLPKGAGTAEKTVVLKVFGNCEACKVRIDQAAMVKGVSKADWSIESKMLTLVYDTTQTSREAVEQSIANSGHDTERFTAPDSVYLHLPGCCQYRN